MHFMRPTHFHVTLTPPDLDVCSCKILNFRITGTATVYTQAQTSKMSFHPRCIRDDDAYSCNL